MQLPGDPQDRRGRTDAEHRRPDGAAAQKGGSAMNSEPVQQALPRAASNPGRGRRVVKHFADFLRHVRRRWYLYLPILAIWGLAYARLFIDATPRLPVLFNWTPSLPYRIAWLVARPPPPAAWRLHRLLVRW
jgi:hypothetical protein